MPSHERPCRYCVANWVGMSTRPSAVGPVILPEPADCEYDHERNDQPLYDLATALARVFQGVRDPSDEQIGWFLHDADRIISDWSPPPERWRVRRLPTGGQPGEFDARIRVNDVTYVVPEGGKGCPGEPVRLSTYRSWQREADDA